MSHRFTLQAVRAECIQEQALEWGKDEMRMLAFAVSRKGQFFSTGLRGIGSYGTGDVRTDDPFPMQLIEAVLEDDGLEVLLFVWLVEEDGGGVRQSFAGLENEFRSRFRSEVEQLAGLGFPRDCIPFTAFFKSALTFTPSLEEAGRSGRDDKVFAPFEIILDKPPQNLGFDAVSKEFLLIRAKNVGTYLLTFRFRYEPIPIIVT